MANYKGYFKDKDGNSIVPAKAEILTVDDIICKNLINPATITKNYYLDYSNGNPIWDGNMCYTDFISIEQGEIYTISDSVPTLLAIHYYDANKNWIWCDYINDAVSNSMTRHAGNNSSYVRLHFGVSRIDYTQFEKGDKATPHIQFKRFDGRTDIISGKETPTNEYVDGERIYRYKYNLTSTNILNEDVEIADLPSGFKKLIRAEGMFYFGGYQVPCYGGVNGIIFVNGGKLQMLISNQNYCGKPIEATIYYVKN